MESTELGIAGFVGIVLAMPGISMCPSLRCLCGRPGIGIMDLTLACGSKIRVFSALGIAGYFWERTL